MSLESSESFQKKIMRKDISLKAQIQIPLCKKRNKDVGAVVNAYLWRKIGGEILSVVFQLFVLCIDSELVNLRQ